MRKCLLIPIGLKTLTQVAFFITRNFAEFIIRMEIELSPTGAFPLPGRVCHRDQLDSIWRGAIWNSQEETFEDAMSRHASSYKTTKEKAEHERRQVQYGALQAAPIASY